MQAGAAAIQNEEFHCDECATYITPTLQKIAPGFPLPVVLGCGCMEPLCINVAKCAIGFMRLRAKQLLMGAVVVSGDLCEFDIAIRETVPPHDDESQKAYKELCSGCIGKCPLAYR